MTGAEKRNDEYRAQRKCEGDKKNRTVAQSLLLPLYPEHKGSVIVLRDVAE